MKRRRSQQRIVGHPRNPLPSCVLGAITDHVNSIAARFGVSRSFVVSTILADAFNVAQEKYYALEPLKSKSRRSKSASKSAKSKS